MGTPVESPRVELYVASADGKKSELLMDATATKDGTFAFEAESRQGPAVLCARSGTYSDAVTGLTLTLRTNGLCTLIPDFTNPPRSVVITPWTHLIMKRAQFLMTQGLDVGRALKAASDEFSTFLACPNPYSDSLSVPPADPTVEAAAEYTLDDGALAGLLLAGLSGQAALISDDFGWPPGMRFTIAEMLEGYATDLEGDGVFNGIGPSGDVAVEGFRFDGKTFRSGTMGFPSGLMRFLRSEQNGTGLGVNELGGLLECVATNRGPLFDGVSGDADGPGISLISPEPNDVYAGTIIVEARASDPQGVGAFGVRIDSDLEAVEAVGKDELEQLEDHIRIPVDTTLLQDGEQQLTIYAADEMHNPSSRSVPILVDNSGPRLEASAPSFVSSGTVSVTGHVQDATALDTLSIYADDSMLADRVDVDGDGFFEQDIDVACNQVTLITLVAIDILGNISTQELSIGCDDQPPRIVWQSSMFFQEAEGQAVYRPNGVLDYRTPPADVDLRDVEWPIEISKFFSRLDYFPLQGLRLNTPIFRFDVTDAASGRAVSTPEYELLVSYRYLRDGVPRGDWAELAYHGLGDHFELPIAYQTLGAELAGSSPATTHRIEFRVVDAVGNVTIEAKEFHLRVLSPPVWFGECTLAADLMRYGLDTDNLHEIVGPGAISPKMRQGTIRYALDLPEESMAPRNAVELSETLGTVRVRPKNFREEKRLDGAWFLPRNGDLWELPLLQALPDCFQGIDPSRPWKAYWDRTTNECRGGVHYPGPINTFHLPFGWSTRGSSSPASVRYLDGRVLTPESGIFVINPDERVFIEHSFSADALSYARMNPIGLIESWDFEWGTFKATSDRSRYYIRNGALTKLGRDLNGEGPYLVEGRNFSVRRYLHDVELTINVVPPVVRHPILFDSVLPVSIQPECSGQLSYESREN